MTEKDYCFSELIERVLDQLSGLGYMDSTLAVYRRTYNRVRAFIKQRGTDYYSKEDGEAFLQNTHVKKETIRAYACAIRRLDDYIAGNPYRCHHGNPIDSVTGIYASVLDAYLDGCTRNGNAPYTVYAKRTACTAFLNQIERAGCTDLSELGTSLVSKALLIYKNKDNYAIIRQFLRYLSDEGITGVDLSGVVPHYRRRKPLPTTYTPEEIGKVEDSVDVSDDTGKRNLAIIRLASRMGLRSGDIAELKWSEIDLSTGYICFIQNKTGLPLSLQMPQEVSDSLLQYLENLKDVSDDGYVFHSLSAPYGRITTSIIRHIVTNAFIAAGVETTGKKHGPHVFRSSLASSMVNDGASYETVSKILGHSDPNVIKHYAKTDIENLRSCSIEPPPPSGMFDDFLSGKKVIGRV